LIVYKLKATSIKSLLRYVISTNIRMLMSSMMRES